MLFCLSHLTATVGLQERASTLITLRRWRICAVKIWCCVQGLSEPLPAMHP